MYSFLNVAGLILLFTSLLFAQEGVKTTRTLSGTIVTPQFELVPNVTIEVQAPHDRFTTVSDGEGNFSLPVPAESLTVKFSGKSINPVTRAFAVSDTTAGLQIKISYVIASPKPTVRCWAPRASNGSYATSTLTPSTPEICFASPISLATR